MDGVATQWQGGHDVCLARITEVRRACQRGAGRRAQDARRRGGLTLQELWLRYCALAGRAASTEGHG